MTDQRIDVYLICNAKYHDTNFSRLELLKLLAEHEDVWVRVADSYADIEAIKKYPIESFMETLKVNVIPEKSIDKNIQLLFTFTNSTKSFSVFLRKGVLEIQPFMISGSSVQVTSTEEDLKSVLSGIKSLPIALVNGTLQVNGSRTDLLSFFSSLRN